jgi:tRNA threonylcarbamoyladenosine biosynthesis protein TsaB
VPEPLVLAFDTATPATAVAVRGGALAEPLELRDDPDVGQRPRHAQSLLPLAETALERAGAGLGDVDRVVVGLGPGSFTGLRIGLATARALALGANAELVGISTLRVLAAGVGPGAPTIVAVLDARRGEVFVAAYDEGGAVLVAPRAVAPEGVGEALGAARDGLAVGDGAVRFRTILEPIGMAVPADGSPLHRVSATVLLRLGAEASPAVRTEVLPDYLRLPDAEIARRARTDP